MRFALTVVTILAFNYLLGLFLPWWIIAVVGFVAGYLVNLAPGKSMLAGFLAGFILWSTLALVVDIANQQILSTRIAALFTLPVPWLMILLTGLIGGIVTGMGAVTGSLLRSIRQPGRPA